MSFLDTINKNIELFNKFNSTKYERFQELMPDNRKRIIDSIPLLLSLNESKLPGYVEGNCPVGIAGYVPDSSISRFIQTRFHLPQIELNSDNPAFEMLAVMGSVGTIAYTRKSDFDYWACLDKNRFTAEEISAIAKKIELIQEWASREIKVDVHIFLNDIESVKKNIFAESEDEVFGSTTGAVLKDEFLRSSIKVAGKIPFWWVLPKFIPDSEYERLFSRLPDDYKKDIFIDLGNLHEISREDFLGAALFQIIKSLGNPFKSIIKIGVLERYLFSPGDTPLLSQRVKQKVLRDEINNTVLDSYILMFEEVYEYYESSLQDRSLLNILKQNLYLKIDPQLSKYTGLLNSRKLPYKVTVMFRYIKEWKWTMEDIQALDNFENWDYNSIIAFWNSVKKFMLLSYQKISSQLPSLDISDKISERDFKLLSRKIRTHFSYSPDKIDNYITFKDTPHEVLLYVEPENITIDTHEWKLFKRNNSAEHKFISTVLKKETDLLKLLAWAAINQIYHPVFSRIKIQSGYQRIAQGHILEILNGLSSLMQPESVKLKNEYFLNEAFSLVNMIVLNFNIENADSIESVHHICLTSWGESYINRYNDLQDIIKLLAAIIEDGLKLRKSFESFCVIVSPEPQKNIYRDIETLFKSNYNFFMKENTAAGGLRSVSKIGHLFFAISLNNSKVTFTSSSNWGRVLTFLSINPFRELTSSFSAKDPGIEVLHEVSSLARRSHITIAYEKRGELAIIYVFNESGNFFTFFRTSSLISRALISLYAFSINTGNIVRKTPGSPVIHEKIFTYEINTDRYGKRSLTNESQQMQTDYLKNYKEKQYLSAEIMLNEKGEKLYSLRGEAAESGDFRRLSELPPRIAEIKRESPDPSLMFIAEIKFTGEMKDINSMGSSPYFVEKYKLEYLINKTLV